MCVERAMYRTLSTTPCRREELVGTPRSLNTFSDEEIMLRDAGTSQELPLWRCDPDAPNLTPHFSSEALRFRRRRAPRPGDG